MKKFICRVLTVIILVWLINAFVIMCAGLMPT